ncbi:tumor protein p53-inducible protein 13 [Sceloporus undulatus]|uniref:tumor protein p53-inducible protein 13 n=1 Tax=Sceloporus undulatus TaxID=8520 RepID=UPI001C4D4646|nr:tumor protein p53-inducible protein 13 [Sceloporus undulatus]
MRDPVSWGSSPGAPILLVLLSLAGSSRSSSSSGATSGEPPPGKHKGVAFLCHPYAHSLLHRQMFLLAQAYLPHHILTPHEGPTWEKPLELRVWDASLQRAEADLVQVGSRFKRQIAKSKRNWRYHRLLKRVEGKAICPLHRVQVLQKLFYKRPDHELRRLARQTLHWQTIHWPKPDHGLHPSVRQRRALHWPQQLLGGFGYLAAPHPSQGRPLPSTLPLLVEKKDLPGPSESQEGVHLTPTGPQTTLATEAGEARTAGGCRCPSGETVKAQSQLGKSQQVRARVPTPRTEEAAWAASALTFLLVVLTLAVLYTRLHQKCRRGRSLYWTAEGEEDHDTVAAVLKRRLLSAQVRRKKRPRQQPRRELLPSTSSDSSD